MGMACSGGRMVVGVAMSAARLGRDAGGVWREGGEWNVRRLFFGGAQGELGLPFDTRDAPWN